MAVTSINFQHASSPIDDPLLPWLHSIKKCLDNFHSDLSDENCAALHKLASECIATFKNNHKYQNDLRFLKVWFINLDWHRDFKKAFREIEEHKICLTKSLLYEIGAHFLEVNGELMDAHRLYILGISRNAEPIENLKKAHKSFLERISDVVKECSNFLQNPDGVSRKVGKARINPWSSSTTKDIEQKILPHLMKYDGYHSSSKNYPGKVPSQKTLKNKIVMKIGGREYHIKGLAGAGGFAQVFKAWVNGESNEIVAVKIQTPPFPWEFYMYRQLDKRVPNEERLRLGFAQSMHHYSDYSILICDFLSHGTLHDAINTYLVVTQSMEEVSCIYYTIEMLYILETLHSAGIIHGDFKPDNLLIRHSSGKLTDDTEDFIKHSGPWRDQGLCLVDWGRGIDLSVFPADIEFEGDCRTSGFRCVEMKEDKPWKFQVDTHGLCVIVHMMLHNTYMEIEKRASNGGDFYLPKLPVKRYWKFNWENFFKRMLNIEPFDDHLKMMRELRESLQEYMLSDQSLVKKLKDSLRKQKLSLCSS
ncbi:mitotic checkpoint serine/threonine-protein kinase BUB1 isoform X1 [Amaranthus tricolor]|uniref:mitotic checkpoint serine/threonine-protein kinase BUB1 isoform X1 n=1 Tax=Amaranthus tricolor TaxID=29722 RepID=UPI002589D902|nr:mitotic checkpoint serine/threonine-protein kinase BUB1 isoform X1 [Amaranthus tricolor]